MRKKTKKGWHFYSREHALAAKGIPTKDKRRTKKPEFVVTGKPKFVKGKLQIPIKEIEPEEPKSSKALIPENPKRKFIGEDDYHYILYDKERDMICRFDKSRYDLPDSYLRSKKGRTPKTPPKQEPVKHKKRARKEGREEVRSSGGFWSEFER